MSKTEKDKEESNSEAVRKISQLISDIKIKKELSNLEDDTIKSALEKFKKQNPKIIQKLEAKWSIDKGYNIKSEEYKTVIKDVRKNLREIYGVFIEPSYNRRDELLENNDIEKILTLHKSTKERIGTYDKVYQQIIEKIGKPKKILDLACGLNPIAYSFLNCNPEYIASDLSEEDLKFIDKFFKKSGIKGSTIKIDLVNETEKLKGLKADVCFLFKAIDSLETQKRNVTRTIMELLDVKWIIISFPRTSLGGLKQISSDKRNWFRNFLAHNSYEYDYFETTNESFFIIKK